MKQVIYDLQKIKDLSDNDTDFIKEMVNVFVAEMPRDLERLSVALAEENRTRVHEFAHKMKPSLDLFGLGCLSDILIIEAWGKSNEEMNVKEHFMRVSHELDTVLVQLKRDF